MPVRTIESLLGCFLLFILLFFGSTFLFRPSVDPPRARNGRTEEEEEVLMKPKTGRERDRERERGKSVCIFVAPVVRYRVFTHRTRFLAGFSVSPVSPGSNTAAATDGSDVAAGEENERWRPEKKQQNNRDRERERERETEKEQASKQPRGKFTG